MPTGKTFNPAHLGLLNGSIDWTSDDIRILILSPEYTFNKAHEFVSQVSGDEVTNDQGSGYERKALDGRTLSLEGDDAVYDANNPEYTAINTVEDLASAVIYKHVSNDGDSPVIFFVEFLDAGGNPSPLPTNGSNVQAQVSEDGISVVRNILE